MPYEKTAIKVENLTKVYKLYHSPKDRLKEALHWRRKKYHNDFYALNNISFEIMKGDIVGIIGSNGAGKSTLLKIIANVLTQTSGNIKVNGKVAALLELGAGFNPSYTGLENIYFQGTIMGYGRHETESKLDSILSFADIGDFIHQPVQTYSSGMFARLAFAIAINVEPDILIVDEALSVGDSKFQHKCMAKMNQIREKGVTILFVSHSIESVKTLCKKAIWLNHGKVHMEGEAKTVVDEYLYEVRLNNNRTTLDNLNLSEEYANSLCIQDATKINSLVEILENATVDINSTKTLKINRVYLENSKGQNVNKIQQNEFYAICVDFIATCDINNLSIGFLIKDQFGIALTGQSIFNLYKKGLKLKSGERKLIKFSTKNILCGGQSYSLAIQANIVSKWDRSDNIQIFNNDLAAVFEVINDNNPMWFKFFQEFQVSIL